MAQPKENKAKLYIGNLDPRVTEYQIINLFRPFGEIVKEDFAWHTHGAKKGEPRGFCFVEYATKEEAAKALSAMRGKSVLGRHLSIHYAEEPAHPASQKKVDAGSQIPLPQEDENQKKEPKISKDAMEAKIIAIKTKLKLMEKEEVTPPVVTKRYQPYPQQQRRNKTT